MIGDFSFAYHRSAVVVTVQKDPMALDFLADQVVQVDLVAWVVCCFLARLATHCLAVFLNFPPTSLEHWHLMAFASMVVHPWVLLVRGNLPETVLLVVREILTLVIAVEVALLLGSLFPNYLAV